MTIGDVVKWLGEGDEAGLYVISQVEAGNDLAQLTMMREHDGRVVKLTKRRFKYLRDHGTIDDPRVGQRTKEGGFKPAPFMPIVGDTIIRKTPKGEVEYEVRIVLPEFYHLLPKGGSWPREKVIYHRGYVNQWERRGLLTVIRDGEVVRRSSDKSS